MPGPRRTLRAAAACRAVLTGSPAAGTRVRAALGLCAGVLVALSLPPFGWWPLAPAGIAVLASACREARPIQRLLSGLCAGVGQFGIGCAWAAHFSLPGAFALVLFEALFVAFACLATPPGRGRLPALVGLLTIAEWARSSWPFGGLPLGGVALGQAGGPLLASARLGGPYLIDGLTFLSGAGLAALLRKGSCLSGVLACLAVGALATAGRLSPNGGPPVGSVRAAIVQGGGTRGLDALEVPASQVLAASLAPTERLGRDHLALVLWPEDVVRLPGPVKDAPVISAIGDLARRLRVTLLAGVTAPVGTARFDNEILAWGPSGRIVASFEKVHPVPFGEYVPFRPLVSHLANLADIPRDAVVGHGSGMVETPAGRFGLLVSYETFFTGRGRSGVRAGGELLLVSTNTASYATSQVPEQELAASRIQAVAEGRDLLQSATTGVSAAIDPTGRVRLRSRLGVRSVLLVTAALRDESTPYDQFGSGPVLELGGMASAVGLLASARDRRALARIRILLSRSRRRGSPQTAPAPRRPARRGEPLRAAGPPERAF